MKVGITERGDASFHIDKLMKVANDYDACIWISKNPSKFLSVEIPDNVILHCTITGLPRILEPNVPDTTVTIPAYYDLIDKYGGDRVVLRVDPIIATNEGVRCYAEDIVAQSEGRTRISFMDLYPHVKTRFEKIGYKYPIDTFHAPLPNRIEYLNELQKVSSRKIEVCGEPGIECVGFVSELDLNAVGINYSSMGRSYQRRDCHCICEKVELLSSRKPCPHGCIYCYWKGELPTTLGVYI